MMKFISLIFLFMVSSICIADDMKQNLMDQLPASSSLFEDEGDNDIGESPFLETSENSLEDIPEGKTPFMNQGNEDKYIESGGKTFKKRELALPGSFDKSDQYIERTDAEIVKDYHNKGRSEFSFSYLMDNYTYDDPNRIFNKTYEDGFKSKKGGFLIASLERSLTSSKIKILWGGNFGFGFNTGRGVFIDNTVSDTRFNLWMLPLDLKIGLDMPLGRLIKLKVAAGPSLMGLIQTRSDKDDGEKDKTRRQMSPGFFAEGKVKWNLSYIFSSTGRSLLHSYNVSNFYLDFLTRLQSYESFQDEFSITGTSIGIGFSFEYL